MKLHKVYYKTYGVKQNDPSVISIKANSKQEALEIFQAEHSSNGWRYAVAVF